MQLAGIPCTICNQSIQFENEATWCATCKSMFHRKCLSERHSNCPQCKTKYDPADQHFVFSQFCPECMQPNEPPEASCKHCRTRTSWDTKADYEKFVAEMKLAATVRF